MTMGNNGLTQKQHKYGLNLFKGLIQYDAYREAGYSIKSARGTIDAAASRLAKNVKILALLAELREKAEDASVATVLERKQVLTEILRARQTDFMTCSADGVWMHDIGEETLNKAGLKKIRTTTMPFGDKDSELKVILTEVELIDPVRAIEVLSKLCGDLKDGVHIDNRKQVNNFYVRDLTDEELEAIIAKYGNIRIPEEAEGS